MHFLPLATWLLLRATTQAFGVPSSASEILQALQQPVCELPYRHVIDVRDLPRRFPKELRWMGRLSDRLPISMISIPASHDAGTARGLTGWTRCQVLTIPAQLALGIRGFDIRLRLVHDELDVYHNEESQSLKFADVMEAFKFFLSANPKEFLVMRIREESKAVDSTHSFETAFGKYAHSPEFGSLFFLASSRMQIPLVSEIRGKIVLLDNYGKLENAIDYPNSAMSVQDDYDTSDMDHKFEEIEQKFMDAIGQTSADVWNVNYTSSSTLTVDQLANARAVNPRVEKYLERKHGHLGLVFMNFPGAKLIHEIVDSNF